MHKLDCSVQTYDWGLIGNESSAAVFKAAMNTDFEVDPNERYAELWMGNFKQKPNKKRTSISIFKASTKFLLKERIQKVLPDY